MERARKGRTLGWDVALCALGVLVLGWAVFAHGQGRPEALRQLAESRINQSLADAGYGWARLTVDDSVAVINGVAPDPISKTALANLAVEVVEPYAGVPGVFWRVVDHTHVNEQLPPRPPAPPPPPEPEVDLLADMPAPGAGTALAGKGPTLGACAKAFRTVQDTRPLRFRPGAIALDRNAGAVVQQLAALAMQCKTWRLVIEAPLDGIGPRRGDVGLAERRAAAIAAALMVEGVPARQIEAIAQRPEAIETALTNAVATAASDAAAASAASAVAAGASGGTVLANAPVDAASAVALPRAVTRNRVEFRLAALTPR